MTDEEYLLTCLMEECGEIIKIASKCIRFGSTSSAPGQSLLNSEELRNELEDLQAMKELLLECEVLPCTLEVNLYRMRNEHKRRVTMFMSRRENK